MEIKKSVFDNEQELLKAIIQIHCPEGIELDPMCFKKNFYKEIPEPKYKFDIEPLSEDIKKADAKAIPVWSKSINCMILDPPFMFGIHGKTEKYYSSSTHGIFKDWDELVELYKGILRDAYRVLKNNGILIFKCQDYTDSKTTIVHCFVYNWALEQGFYAKDLAILNLPKGKIANSKLNQRHLRKVHSYFWIFQKKSN